MSSLRLRASLALCVGAILIGSPWARGQQPPDLGSATIEELLNMRVTTVAKRDQPLSSAAAAVYVITREDIRRSGLETLPEVLRLAPGVEVAQISANTWAISIRGFNSRFANKLLVLIDGRTVYSPTYSAVFWNEQDLLLEDIDRIEVIRGPGATMWGTNAVNGVINIITRSAEETEGALLGAGTGTLQSFATYARYGSSAGKRGHYRLYVKHARRVNLPLIRGGSGDDGWTGSRGGFRSDWALDAFNSLTVQGDATGGQPSRTTPLSISGFPGYSSFAGGNLLARWRHLTPGGSEVSVQAYYDQARENFPGIIELRHDTFDLDVQHNLSLGARHNMVWGGTFRNVRQRSWGTPIASLVPAARTVRIFSGFLQDEIALRASTLYLIAGSKFESNHFTGVEIQPTVRLLFTPSKRQALWAAVSRAMRSPSEVETTIRNLLPIPTPGGSALASLSGNPRARSEELLSYEMGYRIQPRDHFSLDTAAFVNRYHHLAGLEVTPLPPTAPGIVPLTLSYSGRGRTYGVEVSAAYAPAKVWRLSGSYTWLRPQFPSGGINAYPAVSDPRHQLQIHSLLSLTRGVELDSHVYFVGAQPVMGIERYTRLDIRLGWKTNEHVEWSLTGQDLLDSAHPEFFTGISVPLEVRRSVFAKMTWRF